MKDHKLEVGKWCGYFWQKNENDRQFLSKGFKYKDFDVQDSSKLKMKDKWKRKQRLQNLPCLINCSHPLK